MTRQIINYWTNILLISWAYSVLSKIILLLYLLKISPASYYTNTSVIKFPIFFSLQTLVITALYKHCRAINFENSFLHNCTLHSCYYATITQRREMGNILCNNFPYTNYWNNNSWTIYPKWQSEDLSFSCFLIFLIHNSSLMFLNPDN